MKKKNAILYIALLFLQGTLIGTGAILPGISGGVLCVAFGIYEPMMELMVHPLRSFKKNYKMFIPIILGGIVGFVLLAKIVEAFLAASETSALLLFIGLISGTIPGLFRKAVKEKPDRGWGCFVVVLLVSYIFFHILNDGITDAIQPNFWWYVFCGAIWGLSMIVPGLSSSSVLLFVGLYRPMAQGIGSLDVNVIIPLLIGFVATLLSLSKIVEYLMRKHPTVVSRVILGFVISSTLMVTPTAFESVSQVVLGAGCFAVGFVIASLMDRSGRHLKTAD